MLSALPLAFCLIQNGFVVVLVLIARNPSSLPVITLIWIVLNCFMVNPLVVVDGLMIGAIKPLINRYLP